jgi:hypothetical protein
LEETENSEIGDDELSVNVTHRYSSKLTDHFSRNTFARQPLSPNGPYKQVIVRKETVKQIYDDEKDLEIEVPLWVPPKIETYMKNLKEGNIIGHSPTKKEIDPVEVFIKPNSNTLLLRHSIERDNRMSPLMKQDKKAVPSLP